MNYGYGYVPIDHLAKGRGIKKVLEDYGAAGILPGACQYNCVVAANACGETWFLPNRDSSLYVCIEGDEEVLRGIVPPGSECWDYGAIYWGYRKYYDEVFEGYVDAGADERPDLVDEAYRDMARMLDGAIRDHAARCAELQRKVEELKPIIEEFLKVFGPVRISSFKVLRSFDGLDVRVIIDDLVRQGYLVKSQNTWHDSDSRYWFSDISIAGSRTDAWKRRRSLRKERILLALEERGPLTKAKTAEYASVSSSDIKPILDELIEEGVVAMEMIDERRRMYRLKQEEHQQAA